MSMVSASNPVSVGGGTGLRLSEPRRTPRPAPRRRAPRVAGCDATAMSRGLGMFSVALGAAELLGARGLVRRLGIERDRGLVRAFGLREVLNGIGLLASPRRPAFMWARVAGDVLDLATLANGLMQRPRRPGALLLALGGVAAVTVLDIMTARALAQEASDGGAR